MLFPESSVNEESIKLILANFKCLGEELQLFDGLFQNGEAIRDYENLKFIIENACQECKVIDQMTHFLLQHMSRNASLEGQVDHLTRTNVQAVQDLTACQEQMIIQEGRIATLESENTHLKFIIELNESGEKLRTTDHCEETHIQTANVESHDHFSELQAPIPANLATLNSLVVRYASQGRYEVAVPLCKQALSELEVVSGGDHPEVATLLNILALAYRDQEQYKLAAFYLERCLQIREKIFGANHSSVAATLNNLAILLGKRGKYSEAEPLCKRALEIREATLGLRHPDTAKQLNNLGLVCQHQGKYDEVEGYYLRALEIYRGLPEQDDVNIMKTTNNLASAYLKLGKFYEAESLYKSVITEFHSKLDAPDCVGGKSIWEIAEDRDCIRKVNSSMDSILNGILPKWVKVVDVYGASILTTLTNLSALYHRRARHDAAELLEALVRAVKSHCESLENMSNCSTVVSTDDV